MNNLMKIVKETSKRRIVFFIMLAVFFTYITLLVLLVFKQYFIYNSVTLMALESELIDIVGHRDYDTIATYFGILFKLFIFLLFLFYMYLFYRREKSRQYLQNVHQIMEETTHVANGNFAYDLSTYGNDLDELVGNINNIVLKLNDAMEEERHIEHTKNELITNVSHDLRTPLTSIVGYLRLIEQDKYKDEVALRHYTGIAFEKSLTIERLINELFEYTRMQDNRLVLKKTPINIAEVLGQVIIQNELYFKENEMECREQLSDIQSVILGDGERLARVFENLIMNAVYYGKEGKYVDVQLEEIEGHVIVTVTNYGEPIPKIDLPHIFERFYRAEKSRATHTGGSGLGLAIAKSIINHHDGTIEVESNMDKTSFIVKLNNIEIEDEKHETG